MTIKTRYALERGAAHSGGKRDFADKKDTVPTEPPSYEYPYGQRLSLTSPLSWSAPLWFYVCGVAAASGWSWDASSWRRFFLGLLLVGPLLGTTWSGSGEIRIGRKLFKGARSLPGQPKVSCLPYTIPGSPGDQLAAWVSSVAAWWQQVGHWLGRSVLHLVLGTVFSIAVAATLSQRGLALTAVFLLMAWIRALAGGPGSSGVVSISLPLCFAWLIGHVIYAPLNPASLVVAVCFALVCYGCSASGPASADLRWQLVPQVVGVACLVAIRQPVGAALLSLFASAHVLWAPLLQTREGISKYAGAVQIPVAVGMLVAALAIGHSQ